MIAQPHPQLRPFLKVLGRGDGASDALLLADGPVLLKGSRTLDRGLLDTSAGEHFIGPFVKCEVSLGRPRLVGGEVGVSLDDVVFDEGVPCPTVDR